MLTVIEKISLNEIENFPKIISQTVNHFIGTGEMNKPQKEFVLAYLKNYANKNKWIEIRPITKFLGLLVNYELIIEETRKTELEKSYNYINTIIHERWRHDLNFRNFLIYIDKIIEREFNKRIPSTA